MKKIFVTLFAMLAMSMAMPAQNVSFSKDNDMAFGNDWFVVEPLSYLGYGYQIKSAYPDNAGYSDEFFLNAMELGFRPFSAGLISIGVDWTMNTYRLDKAHLWGAEDNGKVWARDASSLPGSTTLKSSRLRVHTFSIPLSFEVRAGKGAFRIGAAGEYNLPANVRNRTADGGKTTKELKKGIGVNEFTYSAFGAISFGGLGIYVKYRPSFQFAEGDGPHFNNLCVGLVLGLGM